MNESNRIELKRELNDGLEKEIVAFLNSREGGILYLGVDDNGRAIGVPQPDEVQLKVKDRLKNNILPSCMGLFDIVQEVKEGYQILKITILSGPEKPYYLRKQGMSEKGCYLRVGSAAEPMSNRMIEDLFAKRTRSSLRKIKSPRQDLTFEQLKIYYNESGHTLTDRFAANLELLTEAREYNYVAYLMADNNGNSMKVAKYAGTDRVNLIESNEYGYCSLIKATKRILDKLEVENRTKTLITSKERIESRLWNSIALREAVINAIVHNDFSNEAPPKFEIFANRIEITSAGGLIHGLNEEEFYEGYSLPRNKEIMRIYKDIDLVEYLGSGIPRILQTYDRSCFRITDNFIRIALPSSEPVYMEETALAQSQTTPESSSQGGTIGGTIGSSIGGTIGGTIELSERQKEVLTLIMNNNRISVRSLAKELNINNSAAQSHIDLLKENGFLTRIGGTRGYWEVTIK